MASNGIRGITIELNGDTTGLDNALKDVNKQSKTLQSELKEVERALKLDPSNTTLVAQKMELLQQSVQSAEQKLNTLRTAQAQVEQQFQRGEIGVEQYRAFQRELATTEAQLNSYRNQMNNVQSEQERLTRSQRELSTFFQATGTDVTQFADILGTRLTQSIQNGTASADQISRALRLMGREALGSGADIDAMREALRNADNGANLDQIRQDLNRIRDGADDASQQVKSFNEQLHEAGEKTKGFGVAMTAGVTAPIGAMGAAAGLAASNFEQASAKIQMALGTTDEKTKELNETAKAVWRDGFGESLEEVTDGLIRVRQNIKGIADGEELQRITQNALLLAQTFESDVNEVTRAANGLMVNFGIDSQKAFDMMAQGAQNGLNFSNELFDNLSEYAPLWADMGYSAEEMFGILEAGAKNSYNLDYMNDVMKEFQIRMKDGSKTTSDALAGMSKETQALFQDFANGKATVADMSESIVADLSKIENQTELNALGTAFFGTKWEDLGSDVVLSMLAAGTSLKDFEGAMQGMVDAQEETFGQRWQEMIRTAAVALEPLGLILLELAEKWLPKIISVVESLAKWFSDLSPTMQLVTVAIGGIVAAIGPLLVFIGSAVTALGPLITAFTAAGGVAGILSTVIGTLGPIFTALTGPIGIAVGALIAMGIALWKNWDEVSAFLTTCWEAIKTTASTAFTSLSEFFVGIWDSIKNVTSTVWTSIKDFFISIWDGIKSIFNTVVGAILNELTKYWSSMGDGITEVWDGIQQYFGALWDLIKNVFVGALLVILQLLTGQWGEAKKSTEQIWKNIQDALKNVWEGLKKIFSGALDAVKGYVKTSWESIKNTTSTVFNAVKSAISTIWENIKTSVSNAVSSILITVTSKFLEMVNSVRTKMSNVLSTIKEIWGNVKSFFSGINLYDVGKNIISGLIRGVTSMAKNLVNSVKGVVNGAIEGAKKLLGINSPSRVFMEFGEFTNEGFIKGIEGTSKRLNDAVGNVYGSLASSANKSHANQIAQTQIIQQSSNIDLTSLVAAIVQLADRPIQTSLTMDNRVLATAVSTQQHSNTNIKSRMRGV